MKKIKLTQGKFALVDDEDFEWLNQFKWFAAKSKGNYYAHRSVRLKKGENQKTIRMHREIMNTPVGMETDHMDHDTLNNQKCNLKICTVLQNSKNKIIHKKKKNGIKYKGVDKSSANSYGAHIYYNGKSLHLGSYRTEVDAALAYNKKAIELHGEFVYLNKIIY